MNSRLFARSLTVQILLTGIAVVVALIIWGKACALAVIAAGAVSYLDLLVIKTAVKKLSEGGKRSRVFYSCALGLKFPLLMAAVYLLVVVLSLDTLGLILGFSTLVMTILYASVVFQRMMAEGDNR